jgi:3-hydroxyisobutyrate dehydrogenase-like beta-hydroxyacid dehydrogenase
MREVVGVVGLGVMGGAIVRNMAASQLQTVGFDIDPAKTSRASDDGIDIEADIAALAERVPVVLTSLPGPKAAIAVAGEIAASKAKDLVVIEASTLALDDKFEFQRILAEAGHTAVDCTLSGTGAQAKVGDLAVYASGDEAVVERLMPLFSTFSRQTHYVGPYGNGSKMKYVANLLVAIHNVSAAEAMVLGMKSGLDPHHLVELVKSGVGNSRIFELRAPLMADNNYQPAQSTIAMWQKDLSVIGDYINKIGCAAPLFNATMPLYASAFAHGHLEDDAASVCEILEIMSGIERK